MDIASSIPEAGRATERVATVAVNAFQFKEPVFIDDLLSFYTSVIKTGPTLITAFVEVYTQPQRLDAEIVIVTKATLNHMQRQVRLVAAAPLPCFL